MERKRSRSIRSPEVFLLLVLLASCFHHPAALSVTVTDEECVYEYILYDGDTVSGNFVVVDHDIFWGSDHPGIDLVVSVASPLRFLVYSTESVELFKVFDGSDVTCVAFLGAIF